MEFAIPRERMVTEQVTRRGVRDARVLRAMGKVPRHRFVEEALSGRAYGDYPLPIGERQTISQPYMVALMTEALELVGHDRVLEIGTGSGYQTAILAELCSKVYSIERIKGLADRAIRMLDSLGYYNVLEYCPVAVPQEGCTSRTPAPPGPRWSAFRNSSSESRGPSA